MQILYNCLGGFGLGCFAFAVIFMFFMGLYNEKR